MLTSKTIRQSEARTLMLFVFGCAVFVLSYCGRLQAQDVPHYSVDPSWPKQLPNNWILGHVEAIVVDKNDHIWVLHFPGTVTPEEAALAQKPPAAECCIPAPSILEFDTQGNILNAWGHPGYIPEWPSAEHALWVDKNEDIWIAGNWSTNLHVIPPEMVGLPPDRNALKFSNEGKLLVEIGHNPKTTTTVANNQDTALLGGVSSIQVDEQAHEVYLADGYINRRIVVYDSETGSFKRGWGAYGEALSQISNSKPIGEYDPSAAPEKHFRGPLVGLRLSKDGLLYVSDRENDRIQIFTKEGKFVKEFFLAPKTLGEGSPMCLTFSPDPEQKYLIVGDGSNNVVWILNRKDGTVVTRFGHRGHNAGQFSYLDAIATDSHGNIYTGEVKYNNRLQKFALQK